MDTKLKEIAEALKLIVDAIQANDVQREEDPLHPITDKPKAISFAQLMESVEGPEEFIRDPIGQSLRAGLRKFGKLIGTILTTDEMREAAEFAAGDKNFQYRINVIDKNWDGTADKRGDVWIV